MTDSLLLNAISWARQAGAVQLKYFRSENLQVETKLNESDIVTKADKLSEQLLIDNIHRVYPTHSILSEESGEESHGEESEYRWIIDPLDGTAQSSIVARPLSESCTHPISMKCSMRSKAKVHS